MPAISMKEAVERLAQAVEKAAPDDLIEIFAELFPAEGLPDVSGAQAAALAKQLAERVRTGIEPEEVVDLWNVVFPADRNVSYDEEEGTLRQAERELRCAEF
jgi:hypothetical protein